LTICRILVRPFDYIVKAGELAPPQRYEGVTHSQEENNAQEN